MESQSSGDRMKFGQAVSTFWRKYVDFSGRARRSEYWWVLLFVVLVSFPIALVDTVVFEEFIAQSGSGPLSILLLLAIFLPGLSLFVRRFHDVGLSGWLVLLTVIPYAGGIFGLVVALLDSQRGTNRFGESAKYPGSAGLEG